MIKWFNKLYRWLYVLKCPTCSSRRLDFDRYGTFPGYTASHNFYRCFKCGAELIEIDEILMDTVTLRKILKPPLILKDLIRAADKAAIKKK
jgi:hypothetical protein